MPDKVICVDFARFTSAGYGTIYGSAVVGLRLGDVIALTDVEADTIEAEVVAVHDDGVTIHARWDKILHSA